MRKFLIIVILLTISLYTCHHHAEKNQPTHEVTAEVKPVSSILYYSAIVEPIKTTVVTSPTDGVINEMYFHFGDEIKKGQSLFSISSDKFQTDYKTALMQYIKAKTDYANAQTQLRESEFLHKNQLISDDDYKSKQTNFYNARLTMAQAKEALDAMQKQIDFHSINLYDLKIENIDQITRVLNEQNALRQIHIAGTIAGVILLANKDQSDTGELKKIAKGDMVKQGDVIAMIGDVSGLTLHINVTEFNINQIQLGQPVKVTGAAFPDDILNGKIAAIDRQGQTSQGGLPVFPVEIIVPTLTREQQARIHMGMSAKVAIEIDDSAKMTIPIKAVIQKNGKTYVKVKEEKNGKIREVAVNTGETTMDSVVIDSGLKSGEKIVFSD